MPLFTPDVLFGKSILTLTVHVVAVTLGTTRSTKRRAGDAELAAVIRLAALADGLSIAEERARRSRAAREGHDLARAVSESRSADRRRRNCCRRRGRFRRRPIELVEQHAKPRLRSSALGKRRGC